MSKRYLVVVVILCSFTLVFSKSVVREKVILNKKLSDVVQRQFDYYFYEGQRLKDESKYDQAIDVFKLCETIDSLDAGVQSELGVLYGMSGMINEAIVAFERAVALDINNWWYNIRLITLYSELKKYQRAIELTQKLQKAYPSKEEVYTIEIALYKETKDYSKAIEANERLENLFGINEQISLDKIQLYYLTNNSKKVIPEIDKLISKYPTDSRYQVTKGNILMQQKLPEQAYAIYQKVLKEDPENANVYLALSEYYGAQNMTDKAMESIKVALKNEQLDVDTKMQVLGKYVENMVKDSTRFGETEALFKLLVERYPLEEQVHSYYALFLQFQNRNAEAIEVYESMLLVNSKSEQAWLRLIQLHLEAKNLNQVLITTEAAMKNLPIVPTWYFYRGITQYQLNNFKDALRTYQSALSLIPKEQPNLKSDFYSQIADTYYKLNIKDSSFVNYELALMANPRNVMVMNNYAYYLSLEKTELSKAERMSAKTVELEPQNSTYLDTYAWILYEKRNYSLAKFYIEKAIDNLPVSDQSAVIYEHYGDILWMNKEDDKALKMWEKALEFGGKSDELKQKIENKGWKRQ